MQEFVYEEKTSGDYKRLELDILQITGGSRQSIPSRKRSRLMIGDEHRENAHPSLIVNAGRVTG